MLPRQQFDKWLVKNKVILCERESGLFLASCLNDARITENDGFTKTMFMTLIYKVLYRQYIARLMEIFKTNVTITLSDGINKIQRALLNEAFLGSRPKHVVKTIETLQRLIPDPAKDDLVTLQNENERNRIWLDEWTKRMSIRMPTLINFEDLRWPENLKMHEVFDIRDVLKMRHLKLFPVDKQRAMRKVLENKTTHEPQRANSVSFVEGSYGDEQLTIFTDLDETQGMRKKKPVDTRMARVNKLIQKAEEKEKGKNKPKKWGAGGRFSLFDKQSHSS